MDNITGASPVLEGLDSKRYIQLPFPPSTTLMLISRYYGMIDPQKHVTAYTCVVKGNDIELDEI